MRRPLTSLAAAAPLLLAACSDPPTAASAKRSAPLAGPLSFTVVASGLNSPRGIAFGGDGAIYVAEAGVPDGHAVTTVGQCLQVPPPIGPVAGGHTGRISRIAGGVRTTVVDGLPSSRTAVGEVIGVTDLAFVGPTLYALLNGGCSRSLPGEPARVVRVEDGGYSTVADLSAWVQAHPTAQPGPDFEPDGDWYAMIAAGGVLYVTEANQGNLVTVKPHAGHVERVVDVSADQGHVVPTALTEHRGDILVGELTPFPLVPGGAEVLRYRRNGALEAEMRGFTMILGLAADQKGNVYVLESTVCPSAAPCFPIPGTGRIVRVAPDGSRATIATGLSLATSLRLGPDGALYVSNWGFGDPGMGEIRRYSLE